MGIYENGLPVKISSEPSSIYNLQKDEWDLINTLLDGTTQIRKKGEKYLPRLNNESEKSYQIRLSQAVLAPYFKRTVNFSTGKTFYTPINILPVESNKDMSPKIASMIEDATRRNENLNVFASNAFRDSWAKGMGFIYVEAPAPDTESPRTRQNLDSNMDIRPYFIYIKPENMLDITTDERGKIIFAKILEHYTHFDEAKCRSINSTRIRVVTEKYIGVYEPLEQVLSDGSTIPSQSKYLLKHQIENELGLVPIAGYITGEKRGDFYATSPLIDLAYTNIQYYQDESTHENAVSAAEFPILCGMGFESGTNIDIGPHKIICIKDTSANLKYVEHTGEALKCGKDNLDELRIKMAYCGLKTLKSDYTSNNSKSTTATEIKIDNIDTNAQLRVAANAFVDAVNLAFYYAEKYLGEDDPSGRMHYYASLEGIFSMTTDDINEIVQLMNLEESGKLRLETLLLELRRRNILGSDVDINAELSFAEQNAVYPVISEVEMAQEKLDNDIESSKIELSNNAKQSYSKINEPAKENKTWSTSDEFNREEMS